MSKGSQLHRVKMSGVADEMDAADRRTLVRTQPARGGQPSDLRPKAPLSSVAAGWDPESRRPKETPMDHGAAAHRVVWADPPAIRLGPGAEPWFLADLKANPGRWALISKAKSASGANTLKKRWGLEAVARKAPTGGYDVYARWPEGKR